MTMIGDDDYSLEWTDPATGLTFALEAEEEPAEPTRADQLSDAYATLAEVNRQEVMAEIESEYGEAVAKLAGHLRADSPDEMRAAAHEAAARLGVASIERHPGSRPTQLDRAEGTTAQEKAKSLARQGDWSAFLRLRDCAALEEAGRVGSNLSDSERGMVLEALQFARAAGDKQAAARLQRQLGRVPR